jgi:diacylglycerol kinase (ATP)
MEHDHNVSFQEAKRHTRREPLQKRSALIIVNPVSGSRSHPQVLPFIESELKKAGWRFEIEIPDSENGTVNASRESLKRGFDTIVACGGDGTVHDILTGMDIENQALGIIPLGSGNDLYRMLKTKKDIGIAVENLVNGKDWKIDVGLANGLRFLNTAGIGIDSETLLVRRSTEGFVKRNYVLLFLKTMGKLQPVSIKITADGQVIDDIFMWAIVCNNNHIGGGMQIAPNARLDDGLLDLILIRKMSKPEMLWNIPKIFSGEFIKNRKVSEMKVSSVRFETDTPRELGIDGDLRASTPVDFKVIPRVLSMISTFTR